MPDFPIQFIVEQFHKSSQRVEATLARTGRKEVGERKQGSSARKANIETVVASLTWAFGRLLVDGRCCLESTMRLFPVLA